MPEPCPIATMDAFSREFLAACHAHNPGAPCMYVYCGRDYEWHVREGVYGENQVGADLARERGTVAPPAAWAG